MKSLLPGMRSIGFPSSVPGGAVSDTTSDKLEFKLVDPGSCMIRVMSRQAGDVQLQACRGRREGR